MKKLLILLLASISLSGQFKFQRSLPDRYTVLHIRGNGQSGSTAIPDISYYTNTITAYNGAAISTTQQKFSNSSIYFDGSNDYFNISMNSLFNFGTGDLTVDFLVYLNSLSALNMIVSLLNNQGISALIFYTSATTGATNFYSSSNDVSWDIVNGGSAGSLSVGQWYHVAIIRESGYFKIYIGGSLSYTSSYSSTSLAYDTSFVSQIGGRSAYSNWSNCYMQELRISKGIARWTSNFRPPNKPY